MSKSSYAEESLNNYVLLGRQALAQGAWEEARACFETALAQEETPEALEGLATAAFRLNDPSTMFDARERAYRMYREHGDRRGAARVAIALAVDFNESRGEPAVAKGWLQRARRLLEGTETCPEQGWLAIWEGLWALPDTATTRKCGLEATNMGRSLQVIDLEMAGLALEGLGLVSEGRVDEGMQRLDEATAAAVAGEMSDFTMMGVVCCFLIYACELVRDYDRAAQWCKVMEELCQRWQLRSFFVYCRTHYCGVLMWRGEWAEAEKELVAATDELMKSRAGLAMDGVVRLAELRRRQGRWEEAALLFMQVEHHPLAQLGRAALALDQEDARTAEALAERFLRGIPSEDRTERAAGLELLVRAQASLGKREEAALTLVELGSATNVIATDSFKASASFAEGIVAAVDGDHETARRRFEDAIDLFQRSGAPFETARSRIELARTLCVLDRRDTAKQEAQAALEALQRIGAAKEADQAAEFMRYLDSSTSEQPREIRELGNLTPRELEVLSLIAQGLSNQEIAERLVLSQHTVHRHVSNILVKLNISSRAAAVAYAARHGLL